MEENHYERMNFDGLHEKDKAYCNTSSGFLANTKKGFAKSSKMLLKLQISVIVLVLVILGIGSYLIYATLPLLQLERPKSGLGTTPLLTSMSFEQQLDGKIVDSDDKVFRDCEDHRQAGKTATGHYVITLLTGEQVSVVCDMETDGGGWTMLLRRTDGSVEFNQNWKNYQNGFGNGAEFWLGNDIIHELTSQRQYKLRIDMTSQINGTRFAIYDIFIVDNETAKYELTVGGYWGNAGDGLRSYNGMLFSTRDEDNDTHNTTNCASSYSGGWWYSRCFSGRLTGVYGQSLGYAKGVDWSPWLGHYHFLDYADMKIRPLE